MRACRRTGPARGARLKERRPTSNHNLALCRVVSLRSEEALRNEFVRFGGLSWLGARRGRAYKEREHIFTVKIHGRNPPAGRHYAGLPACIRLIYSTVTAGR